MSKTKKHPHEKLGITVQEYLALLGVRTALKVGTLTFHPEIEHHQTERVGSEHVFNMACPLQTNSYCGSIGCIGGWMALTMGRDPNHYVQDTPGPLGPLFYPPDMIDYPKITPAQAITAIDKWLAGKKPWTAKGLPRNS
jgi:hypothetical protein